MNLLDFALNFVTGGVICFIGYRVGVRGKDKEILVQWEITVQERRRVEQYKNRTELAEELTNKLLKQIDEYRELSAKAKQLADKWGSNKMAGLPRPEQLKRYLIETIDQLNTVAYDRQSEPKP
jgi:hypothetical protein